VQTVLDVHFLQLAEQAEQALAFMKKPSLHVVQTVLDVHALQLPEQAEQALLFT
jgi:hypothetical protein